MNVQSIDYIRNLGTQLKDYTLAEESDPFAMPLVLRVERGVDISHEAALAAAAQAVATCLADERTTHEWAEPFERWLAQRIRKITRRARASKWERLVSNNPGVVVKVGNAEVFATAPVQVSKTPYDISTLQIANLDLSSGENSMPSSPALSVALNPEVVLSTGKAMAQVGHISQLALMRLDYDEVTQWAKNNFSIRILPSDSFNDFPDNYVEVKDAGYTEVAANTLTSRGWLA